MEERLSAREVSIREFNSLRGRLLSAIESWGLDPKRERAAVTLVKNLSYQNQRVVAELIERLEDACEEPLNFRYVDHELERV
jgi:hypothetical protein